MVDVVNAPHSLQCVRSAKWVLIQMGVDTLAVEKKTIVIHEMSINENTTRPGRRPVKQGPRPQSSNWGWVEKSDTGINLK